MIPKGWTFWIIIALSVLAAGFVFSRYAFAHRFAEKIDAARNKDSFKVGIIMDDNIITIDMPWTTIRATSEVALSEYIVQQMREARETLQ